MSKKTKKPAKFLMLGDTHFGISKDSNWVYNFQYDAIKHFTDYARNNNITTIIQTGDFFDVRSSISQITLQRIRTEIMPLFDGLQLITIVGNHDLKHKEMIHPNSLTEVLGFYSNVTIVDKPTTLLPHGVPIDFIPWICNENRDDINEFISKSKSKTCVGHFELTGYFYYKGLKSSGASNSFLSNYEQVFSGHYHTISSGANVLYVGTPYTLTSGDANDERGAWQLEYDKNHKLIYTLVVNDVMNHIKLQFDADTFDRDTISEYKNKHVDVTVIKRESSIQRMDVNILEQLLIDAGVHALRITDTINYDGIDIISSDDILIKDNRTLVDDYISQLDCEQKTKQLVNELFEKMYIDAVKLKTEVSN